MENVTEEVGRVNGEKTSTSRDKGWKDRVNPSPEEYSIMDLTIRLGPSVFRSDVERKARAMMEEMGVILRDSRDAILPEGSIRVIFASCAEIPEVARSLLELDGVEEVLIETPTDHKDHPNTVVDLGERRSITPQVVPALNKGNLTKRNDLEGLPRTVHAVTYDVNMGRTGPVGDAITLIGEHDTVSMGQVFDSVQQLFDAVAMGNGGKVDLHMIGDRVEVRKGNEDALTATIVHMVRCVMEKVQTEGGDRWASGGAVGGVNISAYHGCTRAKINVWSTPPERSSRSSESTPGMRVLKSGPDEIRTGTNEKTCSEEGPTKTSMDLLMARHMAKEQGWDLKMEKVPGRGTGFSLELGPDPGVINVIVVLVDECYYAIDLEHVQCAVLITDVELKAGSTLWHDVELPLWDLRTSGEDAAVKKDTKVQGLIVNLGHEQACLILSKLIGVQEFALDDYDENGPPSNGEWGLLSSGLRVMIIGLDILPRFVNDRSASKIDVL